MLYIQILIGLLLSYLALAMFMTTNSPVVKTSNSPSIQIAATSSPVSNLSLAVKKSWSPPNRPLNRAKRQAATTGELLSSVIAPGVIVGGNTTKEASLDSDDASTTTEATTKFHRPKPELADGGQLEQSHITKPPEQHQGATTPTPTRSMEQLTDECLAGLDKVCILELDQISAPSAVDSTSDSTTSSAANLVNKKSSVILPFTCRYSYVYRPMNKTESRFTGVGGVWSNEDQGKCLEMLQINTNSSITALSPVNDLPCFAASRFGKKIVEPIVASSCELNYRDSTSTQPLDLTHPFKVYTANSIVNCTYENSTMVSLCHLMFTTTTTITTPVASTTTMLITTSPEATTSTSTSTTSTTTTTTTTSTTTTTTSTTTPSTVYSIRFKQLKCFIILII